MAFRFKRFEIRDERCAMKVGTDGVLLGAWCPLPTSGSILDIGTGSGLIALMLAQRTSDAQIEGVDIDAAAIEQAAENFAASPWSDRLHARHISIQELSEGAHKRYELIVSNPPYFVDSLKNPDQHRKTARHTDTLSYADLIRCAAQLLAKDGTLALILPAEAKESILSEAAQNGLYPSLLTQVYSKPGKPLKRILIALRPNYQEAPKTENFYIESDSAPRSPEYAAMTNEFYL
jgi:tRNA1Val (adenine37-N6)-methyltransferase